VSRAGHALFGLVDEPAELFLVRLGVSRPRPRRLGVAELGLGQILGPLDDGILPGIGGAAHVPAPGAHRRSPRPRAIQPAAAIVETPRRAHRAART